MSKKLFKTAMLMTCVGSFSPGADEPFHLGLELADCFAVGTFKNHFASDKSVPGYGVFVSKYFGNGHGLRWDILSYNKFNLVTLPYAMNLSNGVTIVGTVAYQSYLLHSILQYTYHLNGDQTGAYLRAGLGLENSNFGYTQHYLMIAQGGVTPQPVTTTYKVSSKLALQAGGGYDFDRHWGGTLYYRTSNHESRAFATVSAGVNYTF